MIVVIASGRQDDQATKADYAIKINSQAAARRHSVCQIQVTVRDQLHRGLRKIGYRSHPYPKSKNIVRATPDQGYSIVTTNRYLTQLRMNKPNETGKLEIRFTVSSMLPRLLPSLCVFVLCMCVCEPPISGDSGE